MLSCDRDDAGGDAIECEAKFCLTALGQELVREHAGLAHLIAIAVHRLCPRADGDDLKAVAMMALCEAVPFFRAGRGIAYLRKAIWNAVWVEARSGLVHVPDWVEGGKKMRALHQDDPATTPRAIAGKEMARKTMESASHAHAVGALGMGPCQMTTANSVDDADELAYVVGAMSMLDDRPRRVLEMRYGLESGVPMTLERVGAAFGMTKQWAFQAQAQAEAHVRRLMGMPRKSPSADEP